MSLPVDRYTVHTAGVIFIAAFLVFLIQPLIARQLLPVLGGSPQVWNTVMVFFQGALLLGYLLAHGLARLESVRHQVWAIGALALLAMVVLPLQVAQPDVAPDSPSLWLIRELALRVGLPFLVLSALSPLLQSWFARSGRERAHDPYFLYAASNLGSVLALLAYPVLLEPSLTLGEQSLVWSGGYALVVPALMALGWFLLRLDRGAVIEESPETAMEPAGLSMRRVLSWIALAFVPSSHMLGVTTFMTTDLAPVPLLWIVPLALYLSSFILVFARRQVVKPAGFQRWLAPALLLLALFITSHASKPLGLIMGVNLLVFFITAMALHGKLVELRPTTRHLTVFYFCMSVGGVLGGVFNALLAPALFTDLYEYSLLPAIALLVMGLADKASEPATPSWWWAYALVPGGWVVIGPMFMDGRWIDRGVDLGVELGAGMAQLLVVVLALMALVPLLTRRRHLALGLMLWTLSTLAIYDFKDAELRFQERSFFGVHRVLYTPADKTLWLEHGPTLHGRQRMEEGMLDVPAAYYYPSGPAGRVLAAREGSDRIGIVGLGVGTLAAYAGKGDHLHFFEIDPTVIELADGGGYFHFLARARERGAEISISRGDARLELARVADEAFDILVIDAFSSDAIPLHLTTREAMALYRSKIRGDGALLFHISNDYLDLAPPLSRSAAEAGFVTYGWADDQISERERDEGKMASVWLYLSPGPMAAPGPWRPVAVDKGRSAWSDDYINLLEAYLSGS